MDVQFQHKQNVADYWKFSVKCIGCAAVNIHEDEILDR